MKPSFFKFITATIFIIAFSFLANGQEQPNLNIQISKNPLDCSLYLLEKRGSFGRVRLQGRGSGDHLIELYLRRFLEQCPNSSFRQQVEVDLKATLEILAEHNLTIAKYYLKLSEEKRSGLMGAYHRLKRITEQYPQYSKMDEVLFLLIKANLYRNETEEAKKYYRRILDEFPFSRYICEANKLFL
jgi:hypothetical protein